MAERRPDALAGDRRDSGFRCDGGTGILVRQEGDAGRRVDQRDIGAVADQHFAVDVGADDAVREERGEGGEQLFGCVGIHDGSIDLEVT